MGALVSLATQLEQEDCGKCGGVFALNARFLREQRERGGRGWNCPYCQAGWHIPKDGTELEKARRELEAERARKQAALERANAAEAAEQKLSKSVRALKKRIANGVCPCCTRSFVNLQRHMTTKHPDYTKE
jgi:hypothetical protein